MRLPLPDLRPAALRSTVADILRAALMQGRFQPGEDLSDAALAAELHVSRGPVREALLVLAEEGLVTHNHNKGFAVPTLVPQDMEQIAQARLPLEVLALELARDRASPSDLARLAELKRELLEAFRTGGSRACVMHDFAFHSAIWELSGNPWLHAALRRLSLPYFVYVGAFNLGSPDQSPELMDAMHQGYIDFLARHSRQSAQHCVAFHLRLAARDTGT